MQVQEARNREKSRSRGVIVNDPAKLNAGQPRCKQRSGTSHREIPHHAPAQIRSPYQQHRAAQQTSIALALEQKGSTRQNASLKIAATTMPPPSCCSHLHPQCKLKDLGEQLKG